MKKFYISLTALAVVAVIMFLSLNPDNASPVFFEANVEALAAGETYGGKACETRIKSDESYMVFYCAQCDWVYGKATLFSSTQYCK